MSSLATLQDELISQVETCIHDPLGFARFAFPWSEAELEEPGPRLWQAGILDAIGNHLRNRATRFVPCLIAVSSGHGIGKTALISQIINWAMSTCEDCKIVLTANTEPQLRTKTWPEVSKWFRLAINAHWWKVADTSIAIRDGAHAGTWRTDRVTWTEHNTEAFAGLHNKGKRIVLIFDEASAIADKVWEVAEGALTDEYTEIIWLAFGNPTRSSGRFRECFGRFKHRWKTFQIDSRTVEGTDKQQLSKWVEDYGEDSDFVRVRVRGEFPRVGANQFISSDAVAFCRKYKAEGFGGLPKVLGVDVARFGDDQTVIVLRQGRKAETLGKYRGLDTAQVTAQVIDYIEKHSPDAIVVDSDGIGAPVYDQLKFRGFAKRLFEFHGGKPADDRPAYFNQRAEIWGRMRDWLIAGAEIPDDPEIETDLTGPLYGFSAQQQLQLEKKEDMKKRGLSSPDCFIAGTLVRTPSGETPIEALQVGDLVRTPFGDSVIAYKHVTPATELTSVALSNGTVLTGKGKHKLFSWNNGEIRLDALTLTTELEPYSHWRFALWRVVSLCFMAGRSFGFKQAVATFNPGGKIRRRDFCIVGFGAMRTALYRLVMTFITEIEIGATMIFPILAANLNSSTRASTAYFATKMRSSAEPMPRISPKCDTSQLLGTNQRPDESCIPKIPSGNGNSGNPMPQSAHTVAANISASFPPEVASAPIPVSRPKLTNAIRRIREFALFVAKRLWLIAIGRQPVVPVFVQTVSVPPTLTYNLTLARHNAYYANGVLAFNCGDALAMTFAVKVTSRPNPKPELFHYDPRGGSAGQGWMG